MILATNAKIFVILNCFFNISASAVSINEVSETNIFADGYILQSVRDIGFIMCARECEAFTFCHGFNFHKQHLSCELLSEPNKGKRIIPGWLYVNSTEWLKQKKLSNGMDSIECKKAQQKVKMSSGIIHCSKIDFPADCEDTQITNQGRNSGVYTISPRNRKAFDVYCDFDANGGTWTVIQARVDDSVDFDRNWDDYKVGFGNLRGNFWLGNDNMHHLVSTKSYTLRIDIEYFDGVRYYAEYSTFFVADEEDKYRLQIGGYNGTAGDGLAYHNGKPFSTKDSDNDSNPNNCANIRKGGWWFGSCYIAYLNGIYYNQEILVSPQKYNGIHWKTIRGGEFPIKTSSMKLTRNI